MGDGNNEKNLLRSRPPCVAYVMSRFPKLTETFVLYEIIAIEQLGIRVEIFPLLRMGLENAHPEAKKLARRAHYYPFLSRQIILGQWYFMRRDWRGYFRLWGRVLKSSFGSINFFFGALAIFPKAVQFARRMEELHVNHIHAHFANHPAVAAMIVSEFTGIPYSFTGHGSDLHVDQKMLERKVRLARFAVTVSYYNKNFIVQTCGETVRDKICVIHCGVDTRVFVPRRSLGRHGPLRILCVASLEEVKGHMYLLQACRLLADDGILFVCSLVGDGPLRRRIARQIADLGLRGKVFLRGALARPEVRTMLEEADVFVLPSVPTRSGKREGIPVALMEAMAAGVPVIASDLSGIPELVQNGVSGELVKPRDSRGIAKAVKGYLRDVELRKRVRHQGRQRVEAQFDLEKNAAKLAKLFQKSILTSPSGPSTEAVMMADVEPRRNPVELDSSGFEQESWHGCSNSRRSEHRY